MLQHGGRYGLGAFNVAHFDLLDALIPDPSPALYLALVTAAGLCAFAGAVGLLDRLGTFALWCLYTSSWMLSIHDSYQHHYLLSWFLAFAIFAPGLSVRDCLNPDVRTREASFPLFATGCALVYTFTAISKSSPLWLAGTVLRKLADDGGPLMLPVRAFARLPLGDAEVWHFAALSVVVVQVVVALGFVAAIFRDARSRALLSWTCSAALVAATSFHVSTELTPSFAIGWFSYYMLWTAFVCLSPLRWLLPLLGAIERFRTPFNHLPTRPTWMNGAVLASVAAALVLWSFEDLPGVGSSAVVFTFLWLARGWRSRRQRFALSLLPGLAVTALSCTLSLTGVRFDYYRRLAGELSRMGQIEAALAAYRSAERHAPSGHSRKAKIQELERTLQRRRAP
jgi:hypothetical protein